jgi:hypothetical protein
MTKNYNEIPVKDNMKVEADVEPTVEEFAAKDKEEKKKLKKLVQAQPVKVKKSLFGRLINGVMGPEGLPGIGAYVNDEIIKPAVKNIIYDAITSGLSRALNLDHRQYRGTQPGRGPSQPTRRTDYSNIHGSNRNSRPVEHDVPRTARPARYGVEEFIIEEKYDAAHVLTTLTENADMYDSVSVADYYDLIGVPSQYTDNTYGWTIDTITQARIVPIRGGYVIHFPPVEVI